MNRDAIDPSFTETSESNDSDPSDAIGALDDNDEAGREDTPFDQPNLGEPGPKEDESGDAQGRFGDMLV